MHTEIKTYSLTNQGGEHVEFIIKNVGDIYESMNGEPDHPHRHDYFTLLLIENAKGRHIIDFKEFELSGHSVSFIYPGQVHQVIATEKPVGWVINFSRLFLIKNNIPDQMINDVYLYNKFGETPPLSINEDQWKVYLDIIRQILQYSNLQIIYKYEALGVFLKLLLIQSNNHCSLQKDKDLQSIEVGNQLVRNYKKLIEKHYKEYHKVSDYADILSVTSDYLNKSVKSFTGKSAKEYITDRILLEAKRILLFTEQTNKELAYDLGFEEPSHFSNFFKKSNGVSPIDFRNSARKS